MRPGSWVLLVLSVVVVVVGASLSGYQGLRNAYSGSGSGAVERGLLLEPPRASEIRPVPEFAFGGRWGKLRAVAQLEHAPTPSCHAGTLVHLSEGRVLAAWFGGTFEGLEDTAIYTALRFSPGNWSVPRVAAKARSRVLLYFKVGWNIKSWETFVTESTDDGGTWSEPVELVPGDHGGRGPVKNKLIVLADGTWLAPASLEEGSWRAFVDRSTDGGASWHRSADVLASTNVGVIQPSLWESPPGHVHMLLRSRARPHFQTHIMHASSHDGGLTWSRAHPTSLPNNNAGIDVARMPSSGLLVLAYNPVQSAGGRSPLRLSISSDEGRTWPLSWDVETEKPPGPPARWGEANYVEFSYPGIVAWQLQREGDEEGFTLIYTWHRTRMAVLSLSISQLQTLCNSHPAGPVTPLL